MSALWVVRQHACGYEWCRSTPPDSASEHGSGNATALATAVGAAQVVVLLKAEDVALRTVTIPSRNQAQLVAAAPFAVEDLLAEEISELYFAVTRSTIPGYAAVAVIRRTVLDAMVQPLIAAGVSIAAASPESLAVPCIGDGWTVLEDNGRLIVRSGEHIGFGGEIEFINELLRTVTPTVDRIVCVGACTGKFEAMQSPARAFTHEWTDTDALSLLARNTDQAIAMNLLPAQWRRDRGNKATRRYGAAAAVLFLCAASVFYGHTAWRVYNLESQIAQVRAAQNTAFRSTFPAVRRIVNIRAQALSELRKLESANQIPTHFLDLMHVLGESFLSRRQSLELIGLTYAAGTITLTLEADSISALEGLSDALSAATFDAIILSAESTEDRVRGRLRLSGS